MALEMHQCQRSMRLTDSRMCFVVLILRLSIWEQVILYTLKHAQHTQIKPFIFSQQAGKSSDRDDKKSFPQKVNETIVSFCHSDCVTLPVCYCAHKVMVKALDVFTEQNRTGLGVGN